MLKFLSLSFSLGTPKFYLISKSLPATLIDSYAILDRNNELQTSLEQFLRGNGLREDTVMTVMIYYSVDKL